MSFFAEICQPLRPTIEQWDKFGSLLAEQVHCKRGLIRAIFRLSELVSDLAEKPLGRLEVSVGIFDIDAQGLKRICLCLTPLRGLRDCLVELGKRAVEVFDTVLLC